MNPVISLLGARRNQRRHLPAGEDAGGGEEDDGYWVGGTQQPVAVESRRDLVPQLLAQRHPGGRGQLPAIGQACAAVDGAPRGIQGPGGGTRNSNWSLKFLLNVWEALHLHKIYLRKSVLAIRGRGRLWLYTSAQYIMKQSVICLNVLRCPRAGTES